jgi:hypothetical protein
VISSCSHCGVINAIRQAMTVSGVDKLHAVLGGFHLGVAPHDYVEHTIAELKAMTPDVVIRCTAPAAILSLVCEPRCLNNSLIGIPAAASPSADEETALRAKCGWNTNRATSIGTDRDHGTAIAHRYCRARRRSPGNQPTIVWIPRDDNPHGRSPH